jgi:membrane-associated phospholipid phosphatase
MPLIVLLIVALTAGGLVVLLASWFPIPNVASPPSIAVATGAVEESVVRHRRLQTFIAARLNPGAATGLALSVAFLLAVGGGLVLAVLAYLIRANPQLRSLDNGVARWGDDHASSLSTHGLNVVTNFGSWWVIAALAIAVIAVESIRAPNRWIAPFLAVLMAGDEALTLTIKHLADRARPTLNPIAATLGPSFPSGHSATAAAFYAGAALLLARRRSRMWRCLLAGVAVAAAVGVAASRVFLDVHWLSDVIAGTMLGWGWFAICSIAFGGRLLRFGAPAEAVVDTAKKAEGAREVGRRDARSASRA